MVKNKVQLITYPDSLGGNLKALKSNLDTYFPNLFEGGIHILPPYPSSGDRGFAPLTYFEIDPQFGDWEDVRNLAEDYDILLDIMVNHISQKSPYFQDFLKNGRDSQYADYFLTLEKSGKMVRQFNLISIKCSCVAKYRIQSSLLKRLVKSKKFGQLSVKQPHLNKLTWMYIQSK